MLCYVCVEPSDPTRYTYVTSCDVRFPLVAVTKRSLYEDLRVFTREPGNFRGKLVAIVPGAIGGDGSFRTTAPLAAAVALQK